MQIVITDDTRLQLSNIRQIYVLFLPRYEKNIQKSRCKNVEQGRNDTTFEAKAREGNMLYMIKDTVILPPLYQLIG